MTTFIVVLAALTIAAIAVVLWLAGRWERGRTSNEAIGVPVEILRQMGGDG